MSNEELSPADTLRQQYAKTLEALKAAMKSAPQSQRISEKKLKEIFNNPEKYFKEPKLSIIKKEKAQIDEIKKRLSQDAYKTKGSRKQSTEPKKRKLARTKRAQKDRWIQM